jgi:5-methyltetrahydrofolate--homocysteine methyltransferase
MKLTSFFENHSILLLDGATGSQLISKGLIPGDCPELWNITHKRQVQEIAESYFEAGSDAVLTNTFGGSLLKLRDYGLQDRIYELNYEGGRNVIEVKPSGRFVLASIGPCGKILEPFGNVSQEEVTNSFQLQAKALVDAGVDGFMLETFLDINELLCAIDAVKQITGLPFIASLTYNKNPDGYFTLMGTSIDDAAVCLVQTGAFAIGSNCGNGIANIIEVGQKLRQSMPHMILLLKPNAGEPLLKDGLTCYSEDAAEFEKHFQELVSVKPVIIGGCCGTNPNHIKAFRRLIDQI